MKRDDYFWVTFDALNTDCKNTVGLNLNSVHVKVFVCKVDCCSQL